MLLLCTQYRSFLAVEKVTNMHVILYKKTYLQNLSENNYASLMKKKQRKEARVSEIRNEWVGGGGCCYLDVSIVKNSCCNASKADILVSAL